MDIAPTLNPRSTFHEFGRGVIALHWTRRGAVKLAYIHNPEQVALNDPYFIHSSEYPLFFKLNAYDFDRLTGIDFRLISGEEKRQ
jgi:hypothetical protein